MILLRRSDPLLDLPFAGAGSIAPAVEALIGRRGLAGIASPPTPRMLDLVGLAAMEVLHTVVELAGDQRGAAGASVALWTEPALAVIVVRFAGPPLPEWLLANWDRGEEPAVVETPCGCGWGWLLVREALDAVSATRAGSRNLLYLEKRL
jgi:hypothetical protein